MWEKLTSYTAHRTQIHKLESELIVFKGLRYQKKVPNSITESTPC